MIDVEIKDGQVRAALARVAASLTDTAPVMNEIGDNLVRSTQDRMRQGLQPDGAPLAPRAASTLARYAKAGIKPGPQPLWVTSRLRESVAFAYGPDHVEWGSNAIQAAVMQLGAAQGAFGARMGRTQPSAKRPASRDYFMHLPWGNIPARPFLGVSAQDWTDISEILGEWLERGTAGA